MISFYPGPSRVYDEIPDYVKDACDNGILSINHRSEEFMAICKETVGLLKEKLNIPDDYTILFTSSATECWEIIAQSLVIKSSHHLFNGAFGEKWYEYTKKIVRGAKAFPFDKNEKLNTKKYTFSPSGNLICITHNETSNGTQVSNEVIREIRAANPNHLIAVDATSSMAGVILDYAAADIWFASVQKCFGLPAGLAVMVCSPAAMEQVRAKNENAHYNSLALMASMMDKWQTSYTPNVLGIYLLNRVMDAREAIAFTHVKMEERYHDWMNFFKEKKSIRHLVPNPEVHSLTVLPIQAEAELINSIKTRAKKEGMLLGEGYGALKTSTFRIANFPAIQGREIKQLKKLLSKYE